MLLPLQSETEVGRRGEVVSCRYVLIGSPMTPGKSICIQCHLKWNVAEFRIITLDFE